MSNLLEEICERAGSQIRHIVLAEGHDERVAMAGLRAARDGLATITLLGSRASITEIIDSASDDNKLITAIDPANAAALLTYADSYFNLRKHKGISHGEALRAVANPTNFANMMVRCGDADGSISGADTATPEVVKSALQIIGTSPKYKMVSSLFLMVMDKPHHPVRGGVVFADCGLVIDPDIDELVEIASASAVSARLFLNTEPKLAMLSFSTKGSAEHPFIEKVNEATRRLKSRHPELTIDGELQFDAAIMPNIAADKAPGSPLAGAANVFIFPDLNAGNIGYKIAERVGGATAIGPILQGLAQPANDLSRGCSTEDIYNMIAITAVQAQALKS
jgi:phosphate acetyltransferase